MAVTYHASETDTHAAGTSTHVVSIPAGASTGDVLLLTIISPNLTVPATPAGWTLVTSAVGSLGSFAVYRKVAEVADPGSTVNVTLGSTEASLAAVVAYSNPYASMPIDVAVIDAGSGSGASAPAIETGRADDLIVTILGALSGSGGPTIGAVDGTTERAAVEGFGAHSLQIQDYTPSPNPGVNPTKAASLSSSSSWFGAQIAIRHANRTPNAPTLTGPASGAVVDLAAGYVFAAAFSDPDTGDTPSARAFRRKVGVGAYEYTNDLGATWGPALVWETSTSQEFAFPASRWLNINTVYQWSVAYKDAASEIGPFASDFTVTGSSKPTVAITAAGTETGTSRPDVEWVTTDLDGDAQTHWQVIIESGFVGSVPGSGSRLTNSGEQAGADVSWTPDTDHLPTTVYRRFVRVKAGGQWSDWDFDDVYMDLDVPTPPTLEGSGSGGTAELIVTGTHDVADFPESSFVVEYTDDPDDDTAEWAEVRDGTVRGSGIGDMRLALPGLTGHYASTPDAAALDITGDIDIRCRCSLDDWSPDTPQGLVAKWDLGGNRSYLLQIAIGGALQLVWTDSGGTTRVTGSSIVVPFEDGETVWVRATLDVNDGAGGHVVTYYYSSEVDPGPGDWTTLGVPTNAGVFTTSIRAENALLTVGAGATTSWSTGSFRRAQVLSGIAGSIVFDVDFTDAAQGWALADTAGATGTEDGGATVTIHGATAEIVNTTPQTVIDPEIPPFATRRYRARTVAEV